MTNIQDEPAYSKNVLEFIAVANEYCLFITEMGSYSTEEALDYLNKLLPLLYIKGAMLPHVKVDNPDANERFVTEEQYQNVFNDFRKLFSNIDEYWFIDLESPDENEPVKASLSENFADTYQDINDFLLLYQKNSRESKQNAVYECKKLFKNNWGSKVLNALKMIHHYIFVNNDDEPQDFPIE